MRKADVHFLWQNAHVQTVWGGRLRVLRSNYVQQERLELDDGDFIDVFFGPERPGPIVCLLHGLEGSVRGAYMLGLSRALTASGFQVLAMNHRSCGGTMNRLAKAYHSGMTEDIAQVFSVMRSRYPDRKRAAVGFSLGGNMLLKYLIERKGRGDLDAAVIVSPPIDLVGCANFMGAGLPLFYQFVFLRSLKRKVRAKRSLLKEQNIDVEQVLQCSDFWTFDDLVTAPLHGFDSALDYYERCSTIDQLAEIETAHLFLTSQDDPVVGPTCVPPQDRVSSSCDLCVTERGGHVGFVSGGLFGQNCWGERKMVSWLETHFSNEMIPNRSG